MASCSHLKPLPAIFPPGYVPRAVPSSNALKPLLTLAVAQPVPNYTLTADFNGSYDGTILYELNANGTSNQVATYGFTTAFPVFMDTNRPHLLALTSYRNWPAPGVISCVTNDDTTVDCVTNGYWESQASYFVLVPDHCAAIAIFQLTSNACELAGWGSNGVVYALETSLDLTTWHSNATVTGTNGAFTILVDGSAQQGFYRTVGR